MMTTAKQLMETVDRLCQIYGNPDMAPVFKQAISICLESDFGATAEPLYTIEWHWGAFQPDKQNDRKHNNKMHAELMASNPEYKSLMHDLSHRPSAPMPPDYTDPEYESKHEKWRSYMDSCNSLLSQITAIEDAWKAQNPCEDIDVVFGNQTQGWRMAPGSHVRVYGSSSGIKILTVDEMKARDTGVAKRWHVTKDEVDTIIEQLRNTLAEECDVTPDQISEKTTNESFEYGHSDSSPMNIMYCRHPHNKYSQFEDDQDEITMCAYTVTPETGENT